MPQLSLTLFGPPRVAVDARSVRFDTRKAVALLAVLGVGGREQSREALTGMLWPELDHARARSALRRTLSVTVAAVGSALVVTRSAVRLVDAEVVCDVVRFRRLVLDAHETSGQAAADLASGAFLEGFSLRDSPVFDDWQIATGESLRDLASQNLGRLVASAVARHDLRAALDRARQRIAVEPLSEPAHADLIRVTAWSGDRPGALAAYRSLVRRLDRELGVAPLPETDALHAALRAGTLPPPATPPAPPYPSTTAASPAGPPPLVGRAGLVARIAAAAADPGSPGRTVGLVGESGIGKTALLDEATAQAREVGRVALRLAGHAAERSLPYAVAHDLLRRMTAAAPDLLTALGPTGLALGALSPASSGRAAATIRDRGDVEAMHEAMLAALAALAVEGVVLAVDDAEVLDAPSASLLAYCVRRRPAGLLVLATWSSGSGGAALPAAVTETGTVFAVPPLGLEAITDLLGGTGFDPAEVRERTRGIPLLVQEFIRAGDGSAWNGPQALRDAVAARLDSASPVARQIVGAAAVVGTVADPELLRFASGRDEDETVDAIEEAVVKGLLVERADRSGYDVPHDLLRDIALSQLSLARARLLHGRVADLFRRRHSVDPLAAPAGTVALHLAASGRADGAGAWYLAAARESSRLFAHEEAITHLEAAADHGADAVEVHELSGLALIRLGRYSDARVALDRAAASADDDPLRLTAIEHALGGVYDRLGDTALALAHLQAALELASGAGATPPARILSDLALVHHRRGEVREARRCAERAVAEAGLTTEARDLVHAENTRGVIADDPAEARRILTSATAHARRTADVDLIVATSNNLARALEADGQPDAALAMACEAVALARGQGDRHRLAALHTHVADLLHAAGRDDEAAAAMRDAAAAFGGVQGAGSTPEVWMLAEW